MSVLAALIAVACAIGLLLWWLLIHTEGVYLGPRVVVWLYDVFAPRYDGLVAHDDVDEHLQLAQPLMTRFETSQPIVLDVGTGTGRLPLALCQHARFEGRIIACEPSWKMLDIARAKIAANHFVQYVVCLRADGQALPYPDDVFDCVTCMEALEFMPYPEAAVQELVRVLRPGGLLLTTLRINERWMPGRVWSQGQMQSVLHEAGIEQVEFEDWQHDYSKVWGRKRG